MRKPRLPVRRHGMRSLRNKLSLLFFLITALAFSVIWFFVVPQLESTLEQRKLDELERVAAASRPSLERVMGRPSVSARDLDRRVRAVAEAGGSRVTLLGVQQSRARSKRTPRDLRFFVLTDSREESKYPKNRALTIRAAATKRPARGEGSLNGERLGEIAQPLSIRNQVDWVALYSTSYDDVAETVSFVRNRLLVASALALALALAGGYLVARALARRVRRLEEAAQAVAAGRFLDEPLPVTSRDELGELTRAFNEMQHQLRRVEQARKEFVATASHELRTPIFSLGGFVELLRDEDLDEETRREFIDAMYEQTQRLQKLAVDLLDLSRLDAGAVEIGVEGVDLSELTRAVAGEFLPAVARRDTELDLRLPPGVQARCDPGRVAQIVRILLDNAIRHTPEGTQVTVSAQREDGVAQLTVADDGPGLPDTEQVFDRFYTGDATSGAGLGLTIARELAERMDGSIDSSPRAAGAALKLTLPGDDDTGAA